MTADERVATEADALLRSVLYLRDLTPAPDAGSTRQRIILASVELFAANGYQASSMRQVADRAGIRAASIYSHFESKSALVAAALQWVLDDFVVFVTATVEAGQPALTVLETMVRRHALYQLKFPHRMDSWRIILETDSLRPFLPDQARTVVHKKRELLIELDEALVRAAFPAVDRPRERVRAVNTLCGRLSWWFDADRRNPDAVADFIWTLANAILADSPTQRPGPARVH